MRTAISIKELLSTDQYIIPIYQRNYAWGHAEITQLILDINDFFRGAPNLNYYIGSLVCFKRPDGRYELIDGQQRHTTLSLINGVLRTLQKCKNGQEFPSSPPNLYFDARSEAQHFLKGLHGADNLDDFLQNHIDLSVAPFKAAIGIIRDQLQQISLDSLTTFVSNFYERVKCFRVEVPPDTDLNHYFEIMNNRGEQLEKHEILKARLMGPLNNDNDKHAFAVIWDACSDMSNYVYRNFPSELRMELFDDNGLLKSTWNIETLTKSPTNGASDGAWTIASILESEKEKTGIPTSVQKEATERYKSVIDFPNFLLQVLRIMHDDVSLDDKKLLKEFERLNAEDDAKAFIRKLLECRVFFDRYVIKQDLSNTGKEHHWQVRKPNNEWEPSATDAATDELVMLQTMLHYANPGNTYNEWLHTLLMNQPQEHTTKLFDKLFSYAKDRFKSGSALKYPDVSVFQLYFIDFLLWKCYQEYVLKSQSANAPDALKKLVETIETKESLKSLFSEFRFRQVYSKEHLLAQTEGNVVSSPVLDSIGNLCLISASQNSEAGNRSPESKKAQYKNDNSSLKRLVMFAGFRKDVWDKDTIEAHAKELAGLLANYLCECPRQDVPAVDDKTTTQLITNQKDNLHE